MSEPEYIPEVDENECDPDLDGDAAADEMWRWWFEARHKEGCPQLGARILYNGRLHRVCAMSSAYWSRKHGRMQDHGIVELAIQPETGPNDKPDHVVFPADFRSGKARVI